MACYGQSCTAKITCLLPRVFLDCEEFSGRSLMEAGRDDSELKVLLISRWSCTIGSFDDLGSYWVY